MQIFNLFNATVIPHFGQTFNVEVGVLGEIVKWIITGVGIVGLGVILFSLILKLVGITTSGAFPSVVGSVNTPVIAEAAAVSGETRYTCASAVPLLARKLRLNVRKLTPAD